ncbi:hypothetical protein ACA910_000668 [Epithemia clementina (nom. ined.)]
MKLATLFPCIIGILLLVSEAIPRVEPALLSSPTKLRALDSPSTTTAAPTTRHTDDIAENDAESGKGSNSGDYTTGDDSGNENADSPTCKGSCLNGAFRVFVIDCLIPDAYRAIQSGFFNEEGEFEESSAGVAQSGDDNICNELKSFCLRSSKTRLDYTYEAPFCSPLLETCRSRAVSCTEARTQCNKVVSAAPFCVSLLNKICSVSLLGAVDGTLNEERNLVSSPSAEDDQEGRPSDSTLLLERKLDPDPCRRNRNRGRNLNGEDEDDGEEDEPTQVPLPTPFPTSIPTPMETPMPAPVEPTMAPEKPTSAPQPIEISEPTMAPAKPTNAPQPIAISEPTIVPAKPTSAPQPIVISEPTIVPAKPTSAPQPIVISEPTMAPAKPTGAPENEPTQPPTLVPSNQPSGINDCGMSLLSWLYFLQVYYPTCSLASVRSAADLKLYAYQLTAGERTLVGISKGDESMAFQCKKSRQNGDTYLDDCYDGWSNIADNSAVADEPDYWKMGQPDGKSSPVEETDDLATAAYLNGDGKAVLLDTSPFTIFNYAVIECCVNFLQECSPSDNPSTKAVL